MWECELCLFFTATACGVCTYYALAFHNTTFYLRNSKNYVESCVIFK